ncbi:MAG TPA: Gfo/Idh/MocA family oxidoreductase [Pararhizobium sp.]|nr:Gfo/Idh/MocA family oxidoreductase [Pararhizobium sp.]
MAFAFPDATPVTRPRIGFVGVGWIGRHRMAAILESGAAEAAAIADPSAECVAQAQELAPDAEALGSLEEVLNCGLDGIVIATPSAFHAQQAMGALKHGIAVFCQKPLGRSAAEVHEIVTAARKADRLLGVDMSYRFTEGARKLREIVQSSAIGDVFAADLTFHNAYGPDKPWFHDRALSGGGCVMDLGVHLVDMALWVLGFPAVACVTSHLFAGGKPLPSGSDEVETYAVATLELETGTVVRLTCSWNLHAGRDAVISADFHGTEGGVSFTNVDGSFYDFVAERYHGTSREQLTTPPDAWGGRAAVAWARQLAADPRFDPSIAELEQVASVMDRIYDGAGESGLNRAAFRP